MKHLILWIAVMIIIAAGCAAPSPTATPTPAPLPSSYKPTLEEIQKAYELDSVFPYEDAPISLIPDEQLWEQMHLQLVTYQNQNGYLAVFAVVGNLSSILEIKPYWGSYEFDYLLADLNSDGYTEMIGFFDWGSGIVRSIPFVLLHTGEFTMAYDDQTRSLKLLPYDEEQESLFLFNDFRLAKDNRSVIANAIEVLGGGGNKQLHIYYENDTYYYEYH